MKKMFLGLFVLALALGVSNFVKAEEFRFAVVNVAAVVEASPSVQALKKEQAAKLEDLQKWLEKVRADVAKQQTEEGKEKLIKKYDSDFAKRQEKVKKEYGKKLADIDKNISTAIAVEAKEQGYNAVFAKAILLYGGDDITKSVIKRVK